MASQGCQTGAKCLKPGHEQPLRLGALLMLVWGHRQMTIPIDLVASRWLPGYIIHYLRGSPLSSDTNKSIASRHYRQHGRAHELAGGNPCTAPVGQCSPIFRRRPIVDHISASTSTTSRNAYHGRTLSYYSSNFVCAERSVRLCESAVLPVAFMLADHG